MEKERKQLEKNSKKKHEETFKGISVKLKIEEEDSEINVNSSWKSISSEDRKEFFSKIDSLIYLFKKFNAKYGEKDIEIIAEAKDGKTKVRAKIGNSKMEFVIESTKEKEVFLKIFNS